MVREKYRWWRHRWTLTAIAASGACGNIAFVGAVVHGEVSRLILLYYLSTGWSIVGGRLLLGESIDRRRWSSILLIVAGAWLVLDGAAIDPTALSQQDVLAILAGLAHATMNLLFRMAAVVSVGTKNASMFAGTAVVAAALLGGGQATSAAGPAIWVAGGAFGLGWVMAADWLLQAGVSHLPAAKSSVLLVSELPFTIASAAVLLGERLSLAEVAGGGLILLAALHEVVGQSSLEKVAHHGYQYRAGVGKGDTTKPRRCSPAGPRQFPFATKPGPGANPAERS
jgi:drug/metabolite transporter (DMT)-like permease